MVIFHLFYPSYFRPKYPVSYFSFDFIIFTSGLIFSPRETTLRASAMSIDGSRIILTMGLGARIADFLLCELLFFSPEGLKGGLFGVSLSWPFLLYYTVDIFHIDSLLMEFNCIYCIDYLLALMNGKRISSLLLSCLHNLADGNPIEKIDAFLVVAGCYENATSEY